MADAKQAIWIKDPLAILADGAERGVVVKDGKILELVGKGGEPATPAVVFEARDHVVLPGLINTHHHFFQTLTRALPAALDRELFAWLQALYPVWARLTPETLDLAVKVAISELLLSGCTTTTDHHYLFPAGLEEAIDIEVAVARKLGIRVLLTRGSMNRSQRDGGLPPDNVVQDEEEILADSERVARKFHQRGEGGVRPGGGRSGLGAVVLAAEDAHAVLLGDGSCLIFNEPNERHARPIPSGFQYAGERGPFGGSPSLHGWHVRYMYG